ncbi:MAG: FkbM family methyltransferase [Gammaproteobacteria bacterium]|jgi:FkbM family methyltransferase
MSNRLATASNISDKWTTTRIGAAILSRIPIARDSAGLFLAKNGFQVFFKEEGITPLKLPKFGNYRRSANLFDQREVLFRALVVVAIESGIIDGSRNVIDVGAQNGDSALSWSSLIDGTIYAIDPSIGNIQFIQRVAVANGLSNVDAFALAISDEAGTLYPASDINHTYFTDQPLTRYGVRNPISASTLDALHGQGRMENIGFLHLDVEGMELMALRGSKEILRADRPVVFFECHITIDDLDSIFALLHKLEYTIFMINEATAGGRPDCINFLALPRSVSVRPLMEVTPKGSYFKATLGGNLIPVNELS